MEVKNVILCKEKLQNVLKQMKKSLTLLGNQYLKAYKINYY